MCIFALSSNVVIAKSELLDKKLKIIISFKTYELTQKCVADICRF